MRALLSRRSLRQLLPVLFFLLAAIPAGAIGMLLTQRAWDRELQTVHDQHLQLARHLAEALARYAKDAEAVFRLTAANVAADRPVQELTTLLLRCGKVDREFRECLKPRRPCPHAILIQ